jgi:hypothetical protein
LLLLIIVFGVARLAATLLKFFVYSSTFVACGMFTIAEGAFSGKSGDLVQFAV